MKLEETIKKSPKLKKLVLHLLTPKGQARPRLWVKWFINPFFHVKGKGSKICKRTRIDVLPYNGFYIGKNSTIEDFCTINNGVGKISIGNNTRIGIGSVLIGPVSIGDDVRLAQNVVIATCYTVNAAMRNAAPCIVFRQFCGGQTMRVEMDFSRRLSPQSGLIRTYGECSLQESGMGFPHGSLSFGARRDLSKRSEY